MNGYSGRQQANRRTNMLITRSRKSGLCDAPTVPQVLCAAGAIQEMQQAEQDVCASVGIRSGASVTVRLPGETATASFDDAQCMQGGIMYDKGALIVPQSGRYEIRFSLTFTAAAAVFATLMIQADGKSVTGGVFSRMLRTSTQTVSGCAAVQLESSARVYIAVTSAQAAALTMHSGSFSVRRIS